MPTSPILCVRATVPVNLTPFFYLQTLIAADGKGKVSPVLN
jgi:hypothetical protein